MTITIKHQTGQCHCGCEQQLRNPKRLFLQGHDAKLKSLLIGATVDEEPVSIDWGQGRATSSALDAANGFGFSEQVAKGAERRAAKRTGIKRSGVESDANMGKKAGTARKARAKVGRWEYDGELVIDANGVEKFEYVDGKGKGQSTAKFTVATAVASDEGPESLKSLLRF